MYKKGNLAGGFILGATHPYNLVVVDDENRPKMMGITLNLFFRYGMGLRIGFLFVCLALVFVNSEVGRFVDVVVSRN